MEKISSNLFLVVRARLIFGVPALQGHLWTIGLHITDTLKNICRKSSPASKRSGSGCCWWPPSSGSSPRAACIPGQPILRFPPTVTPSATPAASPSRAQGTGRAMKSASLSERRGSVIACGYESNFSPVGSPIKCVDHHPVHDVPQHVPVRPLHVPVQGVRLC